MQINREWRTGIANPERLQNLLQSLNLQERVSRGLTQYVLQNARDSPDRSPEAMRGQILHGIVDPLSLEGG